MPIYEFICEECGYEFEELCIKNCEEIKCPNCNTKKIKKKLSCFAFKSGSTFRSSSNKSNSGCSGCSSTSCSSCSV